jgi:hypothetical protein
MSMEGYLKPIRYSSQRWLMVDGRGDTEHAKKQRRVCCFYTNTTIRQLACCEQWIHHTSPYYKYSNKDLHTLRYSPISFTMRSRSSNKAANRTLRRGCRTAAASKFMIAKPLLRPYFLGTFSICCCNFHASYLSLKPCFLVRCTAVGFASINSNRFNAS